MVAVALIMAALVGCSRAERTEVGQQAKDLGQQVQSAASNTSLAAKVKTALLTHKGLDGAKIEVTAEGSAVTLKGDVTSREQADLAERVAKETDGVQTVSNQLMLRVPAKSGAAGS